MNRFLSILVGTWIILFAVMNSQASFKASDDVGKAANRNASLNWYLPSYPKLLNPMIYTSAVESDILGVGGKPPTIFEQLILTDPDTGVAECWLCTEFKYSEDKKTMTLKIVQNAKFHDGKPLTAEDVAFSFKVMVHPKVDNLNWKSLYLTAIDKVTAIDKFTVKIEFKDNKFINIHRIAFPIIPKHKFAYFDKNPEKFNKDNSFNRNPVGSGPYKFKKWNAGKSVELVRNDKWWGFGKAKFANMYNFKKIRFKIITNDNVALQAFKKGEFDFMSLQSFHYVELKKAKKSSSKYEAVHLVPKLNASFMFVAWNGRLPIFKDKRTRHALALLSNREKTLQKFSKGLRPPTNGPWGVESALSCDIKECPVIEFDPGKAKKLLAEVGWADTDKDGVLDKIIDGKKYDFRFTILGQSSDYTKNVLGVYVTEMKKAGIDAKVKLLDWTALTKLVDDLNFESYISGFRGAWPVVPRQLWHSQNVGKKGSNSWYFVNKEADKLIEAYDYEYDEKKRILLAQKLHKIMYREHPVMFHHEGGGCYLGRNKKLKGLEVAEYKGNCFFWPKWYKASAKVN